MKKKKQPNKENKQTAPISLTYDEQCEKLKRDIMRVALTSIPKSLEMLARVEKPEKFFYILLSLIKLVMPTQQLLNLNEQAKTDESETLAEEIARLNKIAGLSPNGEKKF